MKTYLAICVLVNAAVLADIVRYKDTYWIAGGNVCRRNYDQKLCINHNYCVPNIDGIRQGVWEICKFVGAVPVLCCTGNTKFPPPNCNPIDIKQYETPLYNPSRKPYVGESAIWDITPIIYDQRKYHYPHNQQYHNYPYYQSNYKPSLPTGYNNIFTSIHSSSQQTLATQTVFNQPTQSFITSGTNTPADPQSNDNINRIDDENGSVTGTANATQAVSGNSPINSTEGLNIQVPFYRPTEANSTSLRRCIEIFTQLPLVKGRHTPIIGGMPAKPKQFPHMALLGYGQPNNIQWSCGGSLVSENYVLTAAHCLFSRRDGDVRYVRLGELDLNSTTEDADERTYTVAQTIPHRLYSPLANYHDIALIRLNESVGAFSEYIRPICLPTTRDVDDVKLITAGWGLTDVGGSQATILQRTTLAHVNNARCRRIFGNKSEHKDGIIEEIQLCADGGGEKRDTCRGDSGGPLQYTNYDYETPTFRGFVEIVGITSFGPKACGLTAGVYTRVLPYVQWIESIIFPN